MAFVPDEQPSGRFVPDPQESAGPKTYANTGEAIVQGPGRAGIVNLLAGLAGTPIDIAQGVYNAPKMIYGLAKGALGGTDLPEAVTGTPGGSESIRDSLRRISELTGSQVLNPDNPNPESKIGTAAYDLASRGVGVPGMTLPGITAYVAGKTLGHQYEPLAALAPSAIGSAVNELTASSRAKQEALNQVRDQTLKAARDEGLKTPPSITNPSFIRDRIESLGGKAAVKQEISLENQPAVDAAVRKEIGLPETAPLTIKTLNARRNDLAEPYREVAALSPRAKTFLDALQQARFKASDQWKFYDKSGNPDSRMIAEQYDNKAKMYEKALESEATKLNRPELVPQMKEARVEIAKTHAVERALNLGDGTIDAQAIGRAYDNGAKLTGRLETIAKFALGPGKQVSRPAASVPAPGVSALDYMSSLGLGLGGYGTMGTKGVALAALPYLRPMARDLVASNWYQNKFAIPDYKPPFEPQSLASMLVQQANMANQK